MTQETREAGLGRKEEEGEGRRKKVRRGFICDQKRADENPRTDNGAKVP